MIKSDSKSERLSELVPLARYFDYVFIMLNYFIYSASIYKIFSSS